MFRPEQCDLCGDCLVQCQWIDIERDQAIAALRQMTQGRPTPVLEECITCYACNEACPQQANPFDLFAELQEKYDVFGSRDAARLDEAKYSFGGALKPSPEAERVLSTCVFEKAQGHLIQGELYDLPRVGGKPYFCWVLFSHWGAESIQRNHARDLVDRLASTGAKEVVCFHDDCYAMLAKLAPEYGIDVPFRPVHLSEHLVDHLKANKDRIVPLDIEVAYQRPCASRHTPEKEHFIDELFDLIGVKRVVRKYDRERAFCCAGIKLLLGNGDPRPDQERNILDAKEHGAQAMVCLCPMCVQTLAWAAAEHEMPMIFLGDLARMALGEIPALSLS